MHVLHTLVRHAGGGVEDMGKQGMSYPSPTAEEWEKELAEKPAKLDWHGWDKGCGQTAAEYFSHARPAASCKRPCKNCGFYYLDRQGNELKRTAAPLCGEW
jgi:hypothetical protein